MAPCRPQVSVTDAATCPCPPAAAPAWATCSIANQMKTQEDAQPRTEAKDPKSQDGKSDSAMISPGQYDAM